MGQYKDIRFEKKKGVARVILNRPEVYNAFRTETLDEMIDAFGNANSDPEIRVIVLTGEGDKAFCTGGDVSVEEELTPASGRAMFSKAMRLMGEMRNNGKPVIAAVKGFCVGGGNELNLMCDVTLAADNAKFGQAGPRVGSVPVWGGTQFLPRLVGDKRAKEIVFFCRLYSAEEALQMGWINKVVALADFESELSGWCDELIAKSPNALRVAKTSMNLESDLLYTSILHGGVMLNLLHGTDEFKEGMRAFLEKRKPDFSKFNI